MRRLVTALLLAASASFTLPAVAAQPMTIQVRRLTLETSLKIARAAIDQCRKEGVQVAVTVLDRSGEPQVVLRDVLAMNLTLAVSRDKAYTALSFNSPTSALTHRFDGPFSVGKMPGIVVSAGGVPIDAGGTLLGAVGVSGAPSGKTDEKCAQAGVDAVASDLEMEGF